MPALTILPPTLTFTPSFPFSTKILKRLYNPAGLSIITMPYTPMMAKVLHVCLHKYFSDCLDNWLCVAFFHDDKDTASLTLGAGDNPLDYKITLLRDLLKYPYIKKIEIPCNLLLTYPSIYSLVETVV
jgi:hypothetical protein